MNAVYMTVKSGFRHGARLLLLGVAGLMGLWTCVTKAAPVSAVQAGQAVNNWLGRDAAPLGATVGVGVQNAIAHQDATRQTAFYEVRLSEGGFVITSADTRATPIIAFSEGAALIVSERNPLYTLLMEDLPRRGETQPALPSGGNQPLSATPGRAEQQWAELLGAAPLGLAAVSDTRVPPFMQTRWDQSNVYYSNDPPLYNYYTPNNHPCGCVATAGAQIMRFHKWPQAAVAAGTYECAVNGSNQNLTMQGGIYDWSSMPLVPKDIRGSITTAQRQAIGKLTSDVGISVRMSYTANGSSASSSLLGVRLADRFGYASSKVLIDSNSARILNATDTAVLANLDAGYPVGVSISGSRGGHFVVADGYGFHNANRYVHLNMGWSGSQDAWYNLPTVDDVNYGFNTVTSYNYNIFPTNDCEIISGRVLNSSGEPITGAAVVATKLSAGAPALPPVTTSASGVFAVLVPVPGSSADTYMLAARQGLLQFATTTTVSRSVSSTILANGSFYPNTGSVGNRWGVEIIVSDTTQPEFELTDITPRPDGLLDLSWTLPTTHPLAVDGFEVEGAPALPAAGAWETLQSTGAGTRAATVSPGTNRFFRIKAKTF